MRQPASQRGVCMKLVAIYGPPGVGKLTVARELARITGFKLFHNHLTVDFVGSIFEHGSEPYRRLIAEYRTQMLEEAARAGIRGVIFTFIYRNTKDNNDVIFDAVRRLGRLGVKPVFVQLRCSEAVLLKRLSSRTRSGTSKITSASVLRREYRGRDLFETVPMVDTLTIDNTSVTPKRAAEMIARHYGLKAKAAHVS